MTLDLSDATWANDFPASIIFQQVSELTYVAWILH